MTLRLNQNEINDVQLVDLLESYPPATTPGFQTLITAKKEFSEMASEIGERLPPGRGQYYKHQKFTHRFLRAYDDLIILSETGTGKSCETIGFLEYVRKEFEKAKVDPTRADEKVAHFKKFIILVKSRTLKEEIKNQIVCRCSDGHYEQGLVKRARTEKVQKSNITLELKKAGYVIGTYKTFARRIMKEYPNDADNVRLANDFADTIFWIDEAHNLLTDPGGTTTYREKQQIYHSIFRVLHIALRSKRIISTATPMINSEGEIGSLMNLVLPLNGMLPPGYDYRNAPVNDIRILFPGVPEDFVRNATPEQIAPYFRGQISNDYNFKLATANDLEPYFRGRITFVRASNFNAVPIDQGLRQDEEVEVEGIRYESQLVIYATEMSQHQSDAYIRSKQDIRGHDELYGAELQASNFVFPDGYWGKGLTEEERAAIREARATKAANKAAAAAAITGDVAATPAQIEDIPEDGMIRITAGGEILTTGEEATDTEIEGAGFERRAFRRYVELQGDNFRATPEFAQWLHELDYIRTLSCKYAEIVRLVKNEPGNCFVYDTFVEGSGLMVLGLCLEGMGFVRYNESTSMFLGTGGETVKPYCSGSEQNITTRRVRPDILSRKQGGPLRYCILSRYTSDAKFKSMMEAMNSYENRHGDYIKVFLSSRVGRDGININNVQQVHLVGSEWNQSGIYQALSRGIRATSHDDLIAEEKQRIVQENGNVNLAKSFRRTKKEAQYVLKPEEETQIAAYATQEGNRIRTENPNIDLMSLNNAMIQASQAARQAIINARYILTPTEEGSILNAVGNPEAARAVMLEIVGSRYPVAAVIDQQTRQDIVESRYLLTEEDKNRLTANGTIDSELRHTLIQTHVPSITAYSLSAETLRNAIIEAIYNLSPEEEQQIRYENGDPLKARVTIKIYKHAAVALDGTSIDLTMYRMAEYKDRLIKRIMRIMKQCAVGCQLHYNRNVREGDVDGSPACDYDVCRYQCIDPPPMAEDYSTYDVIYAIDTVTRVERAIINIFRQMNALSLDAITNQLPQYRRKYIIMALERLITNKVSLMDRFGYTTYLREDKGMFYLDRSYPTGVPASYSMEYYTEGLIGIQQESLANIVVKLEAGEHQEVLHELETMNTNDPQFLQRLDAISIEGQATILEEAILRSLRGQRNQFTDTIINKFQRMIFQIHEPVTELQKLYDKLGERKPRRGRKPNPDTKRRVKKINPLAIDETKIVRDTNTEMVYLHTLYSQVANQTGYAATARFNKAEGRIRLLKPSELDNGWRDLNEIESTVYNAFIQLEIGNRNQPFEQQGIYGFILPIDKKFRIRNRLTEAAGATEDARKINRGKVCTTWNRPELIDVMWEIGVQAPGGQFPDFKETDRPQLAAGLVHKTGLSFEEIQTWPLERLIYYHKWHAATRIKREIICELIKQRMAETGRLLT
jgi:hypothetical protein